MESAYFFAIDPSQTFGDQRVEKLSAAICLKRIRKGMGELCLGATLPDGFRQQATHGLAKNEFGLIVPPPLCLRQRQRKFDHPPVGQRGSLFQLQAGGKPLAYFIPVGLPAGCQRTAEVFLGKTCVVPPAGFDAQPVGEVNAGGKRWRDPRRTTIPSHELSDGKAKGLGEERPDSEA